jgi:hypothetical protein
MSETTPLGLLSPTLSGETTVHIDTYDLHQEVNEEKRNIPTNFMIDLLFLISKKYFIKEDILWNPTIQF